MSFATAFREYDSDQLTDVAGAVFGDTASEPVDEMLAVGFDDYLSPAVDAREEEVGEAHLKGRVQVQFRLLQQHNVAWLGQQADRENGQHLADADTD